MQQQDDIMKISSTLHSHNTDIYNNYELKQEAINSINNTQTHKKLDLITLDDGNTYEGEWYLGMKDGFGVQKWLNGSKYEGEWKEDKSNGKGKLIHANGDVYEG